MFGNINVINRINGYAYQDTPFFIGGGILRR
jgi:hypothetical protein